LLLCATLFCRGMSMHESDFFDCVSSDGEESGADHEASHNFVLNINLSDPTKRFPAELYLKRADEFVTQQQQLESIEEESIYQSQRSRRSSRRSYGPSLTPGRLAKTALIMAATAGQAEAGSTRCPSAPFHPLSWAGLGLFNVLDSNCVGVVKKSGALQKEPLLPGLHFRPWAYFGETIYPLLQIPDTDVYDNIQTKTKDFIPYTFQISVTNQVLPEDIVEVVRKMGFEYDQGELKSIVEAAVREVVKTLDYMDIEKHKSNEMNEMFMEKIQEDLVAKFGPVDGKRIRITMTTVMVAKCGNDQIMKELEQQAMHDSKRQTEIKKREADAEIHRTKEAAKKAELALAEDERKANADREMQTVMADAARRQVKNEQDVKDASAAAEATKIKSQAHVAALESEAEVYQRNPGFSQHQVGLAKAEAVKGVDSKLIFGADLLDSATAAIGGSAGIASKVCKATGICTANP